jgi:hypothetical protein
MASGDALNFFITVRVGCLRQGADSGSGARRRLRELPGILIAQHVQECDRFGSSLDKSTQRVFLRQFFTNIRHQAKILNFYRAAP